jgi:hypothetical protein
MISNTADYTSNSLTYVYQSAIGERVNYTANTGTALVSAANSNLDGSGTLVTLLTAIGGTYVRKITIKAIGETTRGMIRLFNEVTVGMFTFTYIVAEFEVPAVIPSATAPSHEAVYEVDLYINAVLKVSTENAESFIITQV